MASLGAPSISIASPRRSAYLKIQPFIGLPSFGSVSMRTRKSFPSASRRISCSAKPETVEKVCRIVKKQLALPEDTSVEGGSKFAQLGADSLDTVEIVLSLEEAFGISMDEESAEKIVTVQDAADLIEKLVPKKS